MLERLRNKRNILISHYMEHAYRVLILQEFLNTRMNNLYVEGFENNV